jgi:hypothetical protein
MQTQENVMHSIRNQIRAFALVLGLAGITPAFTPAAHAAPATDAAVKPDMKKVTQHLKEHQTDPATRAELLAACNELADFSAGEKRWYADHLPEGTYKSAAEVLKALGRK